MPARMLPYLGRVLRTERKAASPRLTREKVAAEAGCGLDKVRNLEDGRAWPRSPTDIDSMVAIYAELTGTQPLVIWDRALGLWREADDPTRAARAASAAAAARSKRRRAG